MARRIPQPNGLEEVCILIVDDSRNMRELLVAMMHGLGFSNIHTATDGVDALFKLSDLKCDILLTDSTMDPMDGCELARRLRHDPKSPLRHVPIIMVSGFTDLENVIAAREAGVNEFIAKPVSAKALAARIEAVIHRPRPFVRTATFYGPDRRRRTEAFHGDERRGTPISVEKTLSMEDLELIVQNQGERE